MSSTAPFSVRELTTSADHTLWNPFVGHILEGDVLQAWEWGGVKSPDWSPLRLGLFEGETLTGGAVILKRKLPFVGPFYYAPRGPLLADWNNEAALTALLGAIRTRAAADGSGFLKIDPAVPIECVEVTQMLRNHGFAPPASAADHRSFAPRGRRQRQQIRCAAAW